MIFVMSVTLCVHVQYVLLYVCTYVHVCTHVLYVHYIMYCTHVLMPSTPLQAGDLIVESLVSVSSPRRRQHFKNALRQLGVLDPVARRGKGEGRGEEEGREKMRVVVGHSK